MWEPAGRHNGAAVLAGYPAGRLAKRFSEHNPRSDCAYQGSRAGERSTPSGERRAPTAGDPWELGRWRCIAQELLDRGDHGRRLLGRGRCCRARIASRGRRLIVDSRPEARASQLVAGHPAIRP